ncbi:MAG: DUF885 family protein, partial [Woeseiaceae bacterium]
MRTTNLLIALFLISLSPPAAADATSDFHALLDEVWEAQMAAFPTFASSLGDRRYNDRWTDQSLDAIEARHASAREFLRRLFAIDSGELAADDRLNYELFRRELQNDVDDHQYKGFLLPFSHRGGVQTLNQTASRIPLASVIDYEDWLVRMSKVGDVVDQAIARADAGRKQGYMSPAILMERVPDQIATQLVEDGADSPFYEEFAELPSSFSEEDKARLRTTAVQTIEDIVVPAYRKLARYFERTYLPNSRESIGLSELPNGEAWYESRARDYTTTQMTPDEIHRLGLDEVKRIRDEMQLIIDEVEFDGDFPAFLTFLRTDPQFYYDNPDDLYEAYLATSKRIDPELVKLFGKLPRMPYGVKPIPAATAPDTTTAYYSRPAADG